MTTSAALVNFQQGKHQNVQILNDLTQKCKNYLWINIFISTMSGLGVKIAKKLRKNGKFGINFEKLWQSTGFWFEHNVNCWKIF